MWRLSWITFIFLPLTFMVGFFGMNVDTFQTDPKYPSIKWYFIAAVPLMLVVIVVYLFLKNSLSIRREDPLRRGTYDTIFSQFASVRPDLWSRNGPRRHTKSKGPISWLKWHLITFWFNPTRTIDARPLTNIDDMGLWARVKHRLARSWLGGLSVVPRSGMTALDSADAEYGDFGAVTELLARSAPIAMADGDPRAATAVAGFSSSLRGRSRSRSSSGTRRGGGAAGRSGSPSAGSPGSGVMVFEEASDDSDGRGQTGGMEETADRESGRRDWAEREARRRAREQSPEGGAIQLLSVPMTISRASEHTP
jgi:hypothetical protein